MVRVMGLLVAANDGLIGIPWMKCNMCNLDILRLMGPRGLRFKVWSMGQT